MNYGQMQNSHVTMIDQLPELEDLEGVGDYQTQMNHRPQMERPNGNDFNYQKYIRGMHKINPQAGMEHYGAVPPSFQQQEHSPPPPPPPRQQEMITNEPQQHYNCVDIAKHIETCPICSKFYNNDKTVYIIVIVILSIVCLLLLKRVLNV